jgi:antitoxin (DNA-binding transcriptional repressor) of toxin-antitoxin stability system
VPTYAMHFAKTHLSDLVARAEAGEEVILARDKTPAVRLVPVPREQPRRQRGRLKGKITIGDEFFEPLPDEELALWEGD